MTDITKSNLFFGMSEQDSRELIARYGGKTLNLKKGEPLVRVGDKPNKIYLVLSGGLNVTSVDYMGRRTIMNTVGQGGLFGGGFSLSQSERIPFDVTANSETTLLGLNAKKILEQESFDNRDGIFLKNLIKILATRSVNLMEKMKNISQRSIRRKIASFLSGYAQNGKVTLSFTRQEMADYLCVDRASLCRELSAMKKDGLLSFSGKTFYLKQNIDIYE